MLQDDVASRQQDFAGRRHMPEPFKELCELILTTERYTFAAKYTRKASSPTHTPVAVAVAVAMAVTRAWLLGSASHEALHGPQVGLGVS